MPGNSNDTLTWRSLDASMAIESGHLKTFDNLWRAKATPDRLPSRGDFSTEELMAFGGRIALIDVLREPLRYRFRLIGTFITEMLGRDSTSLYLDELYDAGKYDIATAGYRTCVEQGTPIRATGQMVHANRDFIAFEAVDYPLADDGVTVDMILKIVDYPGSEQRHVHPIGH